MPSGVAHAAGVAAESMDIHKRHDAVTGSLHHHARLATRHALACKGIDEEEAAKAGKVHRLAGRLKHSISSRNVGVAASSGSRTSWADFAADDELLLTAVGGAEGSLGGVKEEAVEKSEVSDMTANDTDEGEGLEVASSGVGPVPPLSALAPEFVPSFSLVSQGVAGSCPTIGEQLDYMLSHLSGGLAAADGGRATHDNGLEVFQKVQEELRWLRREGNY